MHSAPTYAAFSGIHCVASGSLPKVLAVLKRRFDEDDSDLVLVFERDTGRQIDFDLRGTLEDVLARVDVANTPRRPGRPKLGVLSREVSLLPRHWDWLDQDSGGVSAALRRVVEGAMKAPPERARRARAALSRFLAATAGDRPNYEEACRALFAGDGERFAALVRRWPKDIRQYALEQAREATRG